MFYGALVDFINFRYRMPLYIYSAAAAETLAGYTMMRMFAFDFRNDVKASNVKNEFMFGGVFRMAPLTEPESLAREDVEIRPSPLLWSDSTAKNACQTA